MPMRSQVLLELRAAYEEVLYAREIAAVSRTDDADRAVEAAESRFHATAEALARSVPKIVPDEDIEKFSHHPFID